MVTGGLEPQHTGGRNITPSLPPQDLSRDPLVANAAWSGFLGETRPTLGGIPLLAKLGQGGMGAVYYGIHPRLEVEVAVKVLPFHMAETEPGLVERFVREARTAARIRSPNLVAVTDVNQEGGVYYLVMEFVAGATAGALLRSVQAAGRSGLTEAEALAVCIAAATGLAAAHAEGIVHRDIKPENILIPRKRKGTELDLDAAKLSDLGLSRGEHSGQSLTGTAQCLGTPGYMAPEQAEDAKSARKPADVFGLGATLYGLLSGHAPFTGSSIMHVLIATMRYPHEPIQKLRPEVSSDTAAVLDRCLKKAPEERYPDADALLGALQSCRRNLRAPAAPRRLEAEPAVLPLAAAEKPPTPVAFASPAPLLVVPDDNPPRAAASLPVPPQAAAAPPRSTPTPGVTPAEPAVPPSVQAAPRPAPSAADRVSAPASTPSPASPLSGPAIATPPGALARLGPKQRVILLVSAVALAVAAVVPVIILVLSRKRDGPVETISSTTEAAAKTLVTQAPARTERPATFSRTAVQSASQTSTVGSAGIVRSRPMELELGGGATLELALIPAGKFLMGSPPDEEGRDKDEARHEVVIGKSFLMGKYEVTQDQYEVVMGANPSRCRGPRNPVDNVSWYNARDFCRKLSEKSGRRIRLPTEAEWEYACRAGSSTQYNCGGPTSAVEQYAWFVANSRRSSHPVGEKRPNAWGLYDIHGNVLEWCSDWYGEYPSGPVTDPQGPAEGTMRVQRGGHWSGAPAHCRSARRDSFSPGSGDKLFGFRVVVEP